MMLEVVPGFFAQSAPDYIYKEPLPSFGLLDGSENRWGSFKARIEALQAAGQDVKCIFLARHGEGVHNLASEKYGAELWVSKWGSQLGDNELDWGYDPALTPKGEQQARDISIAYRDEVSRGMPIPESFYTSPLRRSLRTLELSFAFRPELLIERPPLIVEDLREGCNVVVNRDWPDIRNSWAENLPAHVTLVDQKRSTKSDITKAFPRYRFEPGFTEDDEHWSPEVTETIHALVTRTKAFFERLFSDDLATFIAVSAHGGTMLTTQHIFGLKQHLPPPASIVPLVIRRLPTL